MNLDGSLFYRKLTPSIIAFLRGPIQKFVRGVNIAPVFYQKANDIYRHIGSKEEGIAVAHRLKRLDIERHTVGLAR